MGTSGLAVYIIAEMDRDDIVKIGTCKNGGRKRFKDGSYVNPRGISRIAQAVSSGTSPKGEGEAHARTGAEMR